MDEKNTLVVIPTTPQAIECLINQVHSSLEKTLTDLGFAQPSKQLNRTVTLVVNETIFQLITSEENKEL